MVDVTGYTAIVESDDLETCELVDGTRWSTKYTWTYGVNVPFLNVFFQDGLDLVFVPPDLGIVLQIRVVQRNASGCVYAKSLTRA